MTITQIECFVEAAKKGSFSKAAAEIYISQQTMSRQIKALEEELNFSLFHRFSTGVTLTEQGKLLFELWKEFVVENRSTIDKARDMYHGEDKRLRVGIYDFGHQKEKVSETLLRFNEKHPDLELEYDFSTMRDMFERMQMGKLDMMITYATEVDKDPAYKTVYLDERFQQVGIAVSKSNRLAQKKNVALKDVVKEPIGVLKSELSTDLRLRIEWLFQQNGITKPLIFKEYGSIYSLQTALATDKCITIMYPYVIEGIENKVHFYPVDALGTDSRIVIAFLDEKFQTKAKNIALEFEQH